MKWVRDHSNPYRLELEHKPGHDVFSEVQNTFAESKKWCKDNSMMIWADSLFSIRFTSQRDLLWFLLRWS